LKNMLDKIINFQNQFIDFIFNPRFGGIFLLVLLLKIIFLVVSMAMVGFIIFSFFKSNWWKHFFWADFMETFTKRPYGSKADYRKWTIIQKRIITDREEELKLAIIEADALLDDALKRMGYKGENMTEKLKQLDSGILPNIEEVQETHQLRNDVVYDPDYHLSLETAKRAMDTYEKSLRGLEVF